MARNNSKRFSFGTVPEVESTMERVFTVSPSSAQIVADILRLETVLDMIIKERGAIVPELNFRRGYRALTHDKKGLLKNALKRSSRVSTYSLPAMHPDATKAVEQLRLRATNMGVSIEISSAENSGSGTSTDDDTLILELIGSRMERQRMRKMTQRTTHNKYHLCPYIKYHKATYKVHDICMVASVGYIGIVFIVPATIFAWSILRF